MKISIIFHAIFPKFISCHPEKTEKPIASAKITGVFHGLLGQKRPICKKNSFRVFRHRDSDTDTCPKIAQRRIPVRLDKALSECYNVITDLKDLLIKVKPQIEKSRNKFGYKVRHGKKTTATRFFCAGRGWQDKHGSSVIDTKELVRRSNHVNLIKFAFGTFLVKILLTY